MKRLIRYEFLKTITKEQLKQNQIKDISKYVWGANVKYEDPLYDCKIYRIIYSTTIPEKKKPVIASGFLSIPQINKNELPVVSYQHGTVLEKIKIPSNIDSSYETRLVLSQLGGFGYIIIAADYLGFGISNDNDSFLVLNCQSENSVDLYYALLEILEIEKIKAIKYYVCGWSQGGFITLSLIDKLQKLKINVNGGATAACQNDLFACVNQILYFPRNNDAKWLSSILILIVYSFENYYNVSISKNIFKPEKYELTKKIYYKDPTLKSIDYNTDIKLLLKEEYFDPVYLKNSVLGKLLNNVQPYKFIANIPINMHYGEIDDTTTALILELCNNYQKNMGNNKVNLVYEGIDADHRRTFARAIPKWRNFFQSL